MPTRTSPIPIDTRILLVRARRVILDVDLAAVYGVQTKALNQAVKRNRDRFPKDFVFRLNNTEKRGIAALASHAALKFSSSLPFAFTEHGALMAANVLSSPRAARMSVEVVRAFVRLRKMMSSHKDLSRRLDELEARYDRQFKVVFDAIRQLMLPPQTAPKRRIGFVLDD